MATTLQVYKFVNPAFSAGEKTAIAKAGFKQDAKVFQPSRKVLLGLNRIGAVVNGIADTVQQMISLEEVKAISLREAATDERVAERRKKDQEAEDRAESLGKKDDTVKQETEKKVKPKQKEKNIFEKIFGPLFGVVAPLIEFFAISSLLKWISDPQNQDKVKSLVETLGVVFNFLAKWVQFGITNVLGGLGSVFGGVGKFQEGNVLGGAWDMVMGFGQLLVGIVALKGLAMFMNPFKLMGSILDMLDLWDKTKNLPGRGCKCDPRAKKPDDPEFDQKKKPQTKEERYRRRYGDRAANRRFGKPPAVTPSAGESFWGRAKNFGSKVLTGVRGAVSWGGEKLSGLGKSAWNALTGKFEQAKNFGVSIGKGIQGLADTAKKGPKALADLAGNKIKSTVKDLIKGDPVISTVYNLVADAKKNPAGVGKNLLNLIKSGFKNPGTTNIIDLLKQAKKNFRVPGIDTVLAAIFAAYEYLAPKEFGGGTNLVNAIFRATGALLGYTAGFAIGAPFGGIPGFFTGAAGGIAGEWVGNQLANLLAKTPLGDVQDPFFKDRKIVAQLAEGGIVTSRSFVEIGEGDEPEAVIPISKLEQMIAGPSMIDFAPSLLNAVKETASAIPGGVTSPILSDVNDIATSLNVNLSDGDKVTVPKLRTPSVTVGDIMKSVGQEQTDRSEEIALKQAKDRESAADLYSRQDQQGGGNAPPGAPGAPPPGPNPTPPPPGPAGPPVTGSKAEKWKKFKEMGSKAGAKYPQLVAAQFALESGWGTALSGTHNYFGIKAAAGESSSQHATQEVYNGKTVNVTAGFKNFSSPQDAVNHLVTQWYKDYKGYTGVNRAANAEAAASMLKQQGYATDPNYPVKLVNLLRSNASLSFGGKVPRRSGGGKVPYDLVQSKLGADQANWDIFRNTVASIESGGRYDIAGGSGGHYDGRYQLGEAAKIDGARAAGIQNPGHSSAARAAFRKNPDLQEKLFAGYTIANHNYLMRNQDYAKKSVQQKLQILGYAHNQGMGGAENWMKTGKVGSDGFGTKGTKYTDALAKAFKTGKVPDVAATDVAAKTNATGPEVTQTEAPQDPATIMQGLITALEEARGKLYGDVSSATEGSGKPAEVKPTTTETTASSTVKDKSAQVASSKKQESIADASAGTILPIPINTSSPQQATLPQPVKAVHGNSAFVNRGFSI